MNRQGTEVNPSEDEHQQRERDQPSLDVHR